MALLLEFSLTQQITHMPAIIAKAWAPSASPHSATLFHNLTELGRIPFATDAPSRTSRGFLVLSLCHSACLDRYEQGSFGVVFRVVALAD